MEDQNNKSAAWQEDDSQLFIDYGRYFVPGRETQIQIICDLIAPRPAPFHILELCYGEGLLAAALLAQFPNATVHGYDGSAEMLQKASERLAEYGNRFETQQFDLAARDWRQPTWPVHAVVSSLAIHHLDGPGKQALFRDVQQMLSPNGVFIIADLIQPTTELGWEVAAKAWDAAVRQRAQAIDGNLDAFDAFEQQQWNIYRYPQADDVDKPSTLFDQLQWLTQAGFTAVDVHWMQAGHTIFSGRKLDTTEVDEAEEAFEREVAAFEQMKPALLKQYAGKYVAIYQGEVVAVGCPTLCSLCSLWLFSVGPSTDKQWT